MTAADWIDDLERKAKAATPGPWEAKKARKSDNHMITARSEHGRVWIANTAFPVDPTADAEFIAAANPATILRLIEELRRTKSGARTLGRIIEQQNRDALDASGMHHVVDETGDGDWEVVWEALALLRPERDELAARLAAIEALADRWRHCGDPGDPRRQAATALRAVLSAAPTDTTKETP